MKTESSRKTIGGTGGIEALALVSNFAPVPGLSISGTICLNAREHRFFLDRRRVELLEAIRSLGSVAHAARAVGVCHEWARDAIARMNAMAGTELVTWSGGGRADAGHGLTATGIMLMEFYRHMEAEHRRHLESLAAALPLAGCSTQGRLADFS